MHTRRAIATLVPLVLLFGALVSGSAQAAEFEVTVGDFFFQPDELFVNAGDTVTWTWGDGQGTQAPHNVTAVEGAEFASETQQNGTFQHTFAEEGEVRYICTIHPDQMQGVVTVLAEGEPLPEPGPEPRPAPQPGDLPAAQDAVGTSLVWSSLFEDDSVTNVLLGRNDVFADSLASGALQGQNDAPLLLTPSNELDPRIEAELARLGPTGVVILGGTNAISQAVEDRLVELGYGVSRRAGATRLETAIDVAATDFPDATNAVLARAGAPEGGDPTQAFADSLGAGAYAARELVPVLLSETERLSDATREYLANSQIENVLVAGGTAALSAQVVADLEALGITVDRAAGANRFQTAVELALRAFPSAPPEVAILVEGQAPDAWVGGFTAASAAESAALLLSNGDLLPEATSGILLPSPPDFRLGLLCGPSATDVACQRANIVAGADIPVPDEPARVAVLAGEAEVPPGDPDATGDFVLVGTQDPTVVCYELSYFGTETPTAAHVHDAPAGETGPAVIPLALFAPFGPGFYRGCVFDVEQALVADVFANPAEYYANIHTETYPGGAVRGQLFQPAFIGIAELQGSAEVPGPGAEEGGGFAVLYGDANDDSRVCYFYGFELDEPLTGAHIHQAPEGEAGEVVQPLQTPAGGATEISACDTADPALVADLHTNPSAYYVNLHTETFPGGALRGQISNPFAGPPPGE